MCLDRNSLEYFPFKLLLIIKYARCVQGLPVFFFLNSCYCNKIHKQNISSHFQKVEFLVEVWCAAQTHMHDARPHSHTYLPVYGPALIKSSSVSYFSQPFPPLPAGCCFAIMASTWFTPDNISPCKASRHRSRPGTQLLC